jgi:hypothetical protein
MGMNIFLHSFSVTVNMDKIRDTLAPAALTAVVASALYYVGIDHDIHSPVEIGGMQIPTWAAISGASGIGSVVGNALTQYVTPYVPVIKDFEGMEAMAVPAVLSGLSTYGVSHFLISSEAHFFNSFALGAGSELVSKAIYQNL